MKRENKKATESGKNNVYAQFVVQKCVQYLQCLLKMDEIYMEKLRKIKLKAFHSNWPNVEYKISCFTIFHIPIAYKSENIYNINYIEKEIKENPSFAHSSDFPWDNKEKLWPAEHLVFNGCNGTTTSR